MAAALVIASGALVQTGITAYRAKRVDDAKHKAEENQATLEERRFSMEYWERMAENARDVADRAVKSEHAWRHRATEAEALLGRILRDHPELEETEPNA